MLFETEIETESEDTKMTEQEFADKFGAIGDIVKNAVTCTICRSSADFHIQGRTKTIPGRFINTGFYECQANKNHIADTVMGIFSDLTI